MHIGILTELDAGKYSRATQLYHADEALTAFVTPPTPHTPHNPTPPSPLPLSPFIFNLWHIHTRLVLLVAGLDLYFISH